jgi:preprotein translocase subunit YajC
VDRLLSILPLVGIALLFWFLIVRPARRRQSDLGRMQDHLALGDDVMLTSGIYGSVRTLDEQTVTVEVADGVVLKVARGAVGQVVAPVSGTGADADSGRVVDVPEEN